MKSNDQLMRMRDVMFEFSEVQYCTRFSECRLISHLMKAIFMFAVHNWSLSSLLARMIFTRWPWKTTLGRRCEGFNAGSSRHLVLHRYYFPVEEYSTIRLVWCLIDIQSTPLVRLCFFFSF